MSELRLRLLSHHDSGDIVASYNANTTIGELADAIERAFEYPAATKLTIQRRTRGRWTIARSLQIRNTDLRSGDTISLTPDRVHAVSEQRDAEATLRVGAGPEAGKSFKLGEGEYTIGHSDSCDIALSDTTLLKWHATIRIGDDVAVSAVDPSNRVTVNAVPINGTHRLRLGDQLQVGDTVLIVDFLVSTDNAVSTVRNTVQFNRPPLLLNKSFKPLTLSLASVPEPPKRPTGSVATMLMPLIAGCAMYLFTRKLYSVAYMAMSPLMALVYFLEQKWFAKKSVSDRSSPSEDSASLADQIEALDSAYEANTKSRFQLSPDTYELLDCVAGLDQRLWERAPENPNFLHLRIGLDEQPSEIRIEVHDGGNLDQRKELDTIAREYDTLPPVPLTIDARHLTPIGIAGHREPSGDLARSFLLQASVLHSPNELVVSGLFSEDLAPEWDWLKWLPHTDNAHSPLDSPAIGVGTAVGFEILANLQDLVDERLAVHRPGPSSIPPNFVPHVLVAIDGSLPIKQAHFDRLLKHGEAAGVSIVWIAPDRRRLPNVCRSVLTLAHDGKSVAVETSENGNGTHQIRFEGVKRDVAEIAARQLAPIVDASTATPGRADIPDVVSLFDLLGGVGLLDDTTAITEWWRESRQEMNLRAPVGVSEDGPLTIDLRVDGPHGLVGGTSGAGKSEFLQTLLVSLAALNSPDRINFLLVDYKGGSAFGDLIDQFDGSGRLERKGLAHSVGTITDLTPALAQRALVSLKAELHRREVILNTHQVKDLIEMEKRGISNTPPSLLIVIDEFAALAKDVPAFVDGVVDISQRGRSLGIHLLLATQKASAGATANIQANTNLRVALRMAFEDESTDVVHSPIAARIDRSRPGRGVMRKDESNLVRFQSAYVGGQTSLALAATPRVGHFSLDGIRWLITDSAVVSDADDGGSDLRQLVRLINEAATADSLPIPRRPWIDPLPEHVNLLQLPRPTDGVSVPFGLADLPRAQTRSLATFDPDEIGNMLLIGARATGKSTAMRTIAAAFGLSLPKSPVQIYCIDFKARSLETLSALSYVRSITPGEDHERLVSLFDDLKSELCERSGRCAKPSVATLGGYRSSQEGEASLPRLVILLDGYDAFTSTYGHLDGGRLVDDLSTLIADGSQVGINVILSGTRPSSFPVALTRHVSSRLVFRMESDDDYINLGYDPDHFERSMPAGRCWYGELEVQVATVGEGTDPEPGAGAGPSVSTTLGPDRRRHAQ